jgi:hypothetical protein
MRHCQAERPHAQVGRPRDKLESGSQQIGCYGLLSEQFDFGTRMHVRDASDLDEHGIHSWLATEAAPRNEIDRGCHQGFRLI